VCPNLKLVLYLIVQNHHGAASSRVVGEFRRSAKERSPLKRQRHYKVVMSCIAAKFSNGVIELKL
jgi:hypothetical protein